MNEQVTTQESVRVFISLASEDTIYGDELLKHLALLQRQGIISSWCTRQILAGTNRVEKIDEYLEVASVFLPLISPDFIASEECFTRELPRAMQKYKNNQALVIPILLRAVDWTGSPFDGLQMLPRNARPITSWDNQDEAFSQVAIEIREALENIHFSRHLPFSSIPQISLMPQIWNVPYLRNNFFTGRKEILEQIYDNFFTNTQRMHTQALCGLGGIGKTQIALEYAYNYRSKYRYVLWVNAADTDLLASDFIRLADTLHLPNKSNLDSLFIVQSVKDWLASHSDWLIIFDNADELSKVSTFLPSGGNGHILLTTCTQAPRAIATAIDVVKMHEKEALLFLLRRSGFLAVDALFMQTEESDLETAKAIVKEIDNLPLALDQVGAYIEETKCSFAEYLNLYHMHNHRLSLLEYRSSLSSYPKSVVSTLLLSVERVRQANAAAADILEICAFLHPDAIPEELIIDNVPALSSALQGLASNQLKKDITFKELLKYSLIYRDARTKTVTVHRLVQVILKENMTKKRQQYWSKKLIRAIYSFFCIKVREPNDMGYLITSDRAMRYLFHAWSCAELIKQWNIKSVEAVELLVELGRWISLLFDDKDKDITELCEQAATIQSDIFGPDHPNTGKMLTLLASIYENQGKVDLAETMLQKVQSIYDNKLSPANPNIIRNLISLTLLYLAQKKYENAENCLQKIFKMYDKIAYKNVPLGANGMSAIRNLLIQCYQHQCKYDKIEEILTEDLELAKQQYGPVHFFVGGALNRLAGFYHSQGEKTRAEAAYSQALDIWMEILKALSSFKEDPGYKNAWENCLDALKNLLKNYISLLKEMNWKQGTKEIEKILKILEEISPEVNAAKHTIEIRPSPFLLDNVIVTSGGEQDERKVIIHVYNNVIEK